MQFYLIPSPIADISHKHSWTWAQRAYFAKELSKNDIFVIEDPFLILREQTNKSELAFRHVFINELMTRAETNTERAAKRCVGRSAC